MVAKVFILYLVLQPREMASPAGLKFGQSSLISISENSNGTLFETQRQAN